MLGLLALTGADESPSWWDSRSRENGVHPRRIQMIAQLLKTHAASGTTQYIVTTHSPILPDLLPDESLFVVQLVDRRTRIDSFATWGTLGRRRDIGRALDEPPGRASCGGADPARRFRCVRSPCSSRTTPISRSSERLYSVSPTSSGLALRLDWRSAVRGHGRVVRELAYYLRDLARQDDRTPDLIIAATDANCSGLNERAREIANQDAPAPMISAVPDPHVERWLLLDGAASRPCSAGDATRPIRSATVISTSNDSSRPSALPGSFPASAESSSPRTSCDTWTSSVRCGRTAPSDDSLTISVAR